MNRKTKLEKKAKFLTKKDIKLLETIAENNTLTDREFYLLFIAETGSREKNARRIKRIFGEK